MSSVPRLPQMPGLLDYPRLQGALIELGCRDVIDFVVGLERVPILVLDGMWVGKDGSSTWQRVDLGYLNSAGADWRARCPPKLRDVPARITELLRSALAEDPAALWRLALYQLAAALNGLGPARLRTELAGRGIRQEEVDLLTLAIAAADIRAIEVEELLVAVSSNALLRATRTAGRLRSSATDPKLIELLEDIQTRGDRLTDLVALAARYESQGDTEGAAARYLLAEELTTDDPSIAEALARCAPQPPRWLKARVADDEVILEWPPASASAGRVSYEVSLDGTVLGTLAEPGFADRDPPLGRPVGYEVRTLRDGRFRSAPVACPAIRVAPEIRELTIEATRKGIVGTWLAPRRVERIRVVRTDGGFESVIQPGSTGFVDPTAVHEGIYTYRVTCGYGSSWSSGRKAGVSVVPWPQPVLDAQITTSGRNLTVSATVPSQGVVLLIRAGPDCPVPGTDLPSKAVQSLGDRLGQLSCNPLNLPLTENGRHRLALITVLGDLAVVGAVRAAEVLPPVTDLKATRRGDEVLLTWRWPDEVTRAVVSWSGRPVEVTRHGYADRGVRLRMGALAGSFSVTSASTVSGSLTASHSAEVSIEELTKVTYEIRRRRRQPVRIIVSISGPVRGSQEFRLRVKEGRNRPRDSEDGRLLLTLKLADLTPGEEVEQDLELRSVRSPYVLRGFVQPHDQRIWLEHPRLEQLRVVS